jgi:GcrA cell cycle regulator
MARLPNRTTSKNISNHLKAAAKQTGPAKNDGLTANVGFDTRSQLGRDILVDVLAAAARILRNNRERLQKVQPADPARAAARRDVASTQSQVRTEATPRAEDSGVELISSSVGFAQPAAGALTLAPLAQRGGERGQARKPNDIASSGKPKEGVHLYDLRRTSCRWPLGTFLAATELFCGAASTPGCPYCTEHRELAFARVGVRRAEKIAASPHGRLQRRSSSEHAAPSH